MTEFLSNSIFLFHKIFTIKTNNYLKKSDRWTVKDTEQGA